MAIRLDPYQNIVGVGWGRPTFTFSFTIGAAIGAFQASIEVDFSTGYSTGLLPGPPDVNAAGVVVAMADVWQNEGPPPSIITATLKGNSTAGFHSPMGWAVALNRDDETLGSLSDMGEVPLVVTVAFNLSAGTVTLVDD